MNSTAGTNEDGSINVFSMLFHALYDAAAQLTSIFGLTPIQFIAIVGCIIALVLGWSFTQAVRGQTKFSLEPEPEDE
jgi:hypothetical protein